MLSLIFLFQAASGQAAPPPAPQRAASFIREDDYRVAEVGYRIATGGLRFCPSSTPTLGIALHHLAEYEEGDRARAIADHALDRGPGIVAVVADSPAARAGLMAGDVVLAVAGVPLPAPTQAAIGEPAQVRIAIERTERLLDQGLAAGPSRLSVLRDGVTRDIAVVPRAGCPARVRLARSRQFNAFANRGYAIMTTRLLAFVRSDDELAIVMGHEMAHAILGHPESLDAKGVDGGISATFGSGAAEIRRTEVEADRLGLKLAWAAGYDVGAAIPFWRRYTARRGPRLNFTHPGLRNRERIVAETIAELHALRQGAKAPQLGEGALPQR